eukprot:14571519-Alexandrium_andersonii.AAC.1
MCIRDRPCASFARPAPLPFSWSLWWVGRGSSSPPSAGPPWAPPKPPSRTALGASLSRALQPLPLSEARAPRPSA